MALPFVLNAKFDLELILYITIFVFLSPGSCFKSAICIQNSLESATIILFSPRLKEGKIFFQKGLRTPFTLVFHSETTKTSIFVFPFHFKCQSSNFCILGVNKTLEVCRFVVQRAMITCAFRAHDFKTKNHFSRTPKVV